MNEERNVLFKAETILDLPVWKEYCAAFRMTDRKSLIWCIISILLLTYCTVMILMTPSIAPTVLISGGIGLILSLIFGSRNRNGKKAYQQLLESHGGKNPHRIYHFEEDGVISRNVQKNTMTEFGYNQITKIIDADRLLLLVLDTNECVAIDPRWLQGCTREMLLQFLKETCKIPKKAVKAVSFGKILHMINHIVAAVLLIVAVVFSALRTPPIDVTGSLPANLSVKESAVILESMAIHCTDEDISDAENWEMEYREYFPNISVTFTTEDRMLSLLCNAGYGSYDWDTWEWTPPGSGVLWLDMEAFDLSNMYTQYLLGLSAISDGALVFSDIEENHDGVDWEKGIGNIYLSFTLNGTHHKITAEMDSDWYDVSALDEINKIINSCGENNIYVASDAGQGILVFYRDATWASEFTSLTGINLFMKVSALWYKNPY